MAVRMSPAGGHALPGWVRTRAGTDPGTIHLTVVDPGAVTAEAVRQCCEHLALAGYRRAITNAMGPRDADALLAAGFAVRECLDLLARPLDAVPAPGGPTRRARRLGPVVALDRRAFGERGFDRAALLDARDATPVARLRVCGRPAQPTGYAVTGLAGSRAYLQRLAVDPAARRTGTARRLLLDGLGWAHRRGARTALVNTHADNAPARVLYESVGFVALPDGLRVLERVL
jgi:GNAT superfamily N-acetyltransferase